MFAGSTATVEPPHSLQIEGAKTLEHAVSINKDLLATVTFSESQFRHCSLTILQRDAKP